MLDGEQSPPGQFLVAETGVSDVPTVPDTKAVELGLRFTSRSNGRLTGVRLLKAKGLGSSHLVNVWSVGVQKLARVTSTTESRSGWQDVKLSKPVPSAAGKGIRRLLSDGQLAQQADDVVLVVLGQRMV